MITASLLGTILAIWILLRLLHLMVRVAWGVIKIVIVLALASAILGGSVVVVGASALPVLAVISIIFLFIK